MPWPDDVTLIVELGFGSGPLAATPTWTDVTADVRAVRTARGRGSVHERFDPGSATILLDNGAGDYDPANTQSDNWPDMTLGTPVRIRATYDSMTYPIFYGAVSRWPLAFTMPSDGLVELEVTENLGLLYSAVLDGGSFVEESADDRVDNVLDDIGWPALQRDLAAALVTVAEVLVADGEAGEHLDWVVEAEQGRFFIARDGDATLLGRAEFSAASSAATFGGAGLSYNDIGLAYDDDLLVNKARITTSTGVRQVAADSQSATAHGPRLYESENPLLRNGPEALNVAEWIVGKYKDVKVRIAGIVISPQKAPVSLWPEVLGRELGDVITVQFDPPGAGDTYDQVVAVESISHEIAPGFWETTYGCHPLSDLEQESFWILGTSDDLGADTILA